MHKIIDKLNADLRSIHIINDKMRVREFYLISLEDAYELLEDIADISGTKDRLRLYKPTKEEVIEEETTEKNGELSKNRYHFKNIKFKWLEKVLLIIGAIVLLCILSTINKPGVEVV